MKPPSALARHRRARAALRVVIPDDQRRCACLTDGDRRNGRVCITHDRP